MEQLDWFLKRKGEIAAKYNEAFSGIGSVSQTLPTGNHVTNSHWLYTILLDRNSRDLLKHLEGEKIQTRPLWRTLSELPYLSGCHVVSDRNARELVDKALSLPCSVGLEAEHQDSVLAEASAFLGRA